MSEQPWMTMRWFAVVNDLVGGWSLATIDQPVSLINVMDVNTWVPVDCLDEATARHIATLHNASLSMEAMRAITVEALPEP